MPLTYDGKFRFLVVELEPKELNDLMEKTCRENVQLNLMQSDPKGLLFKKREPERKKTTVVSMITTLFLWLLMMGLIVLGGIKLVELITNVL